MPRPRRVLRPRARPTAGGRFRSGTVRRRARRRPEPARSPETRPLRPGRPRHRRETCPPRPSHSSISSRLTIAPDSTTSRSSFGARSPIRPTATVATRAAATAATATRASDVRAPRCRGRPSATRLANAAAPDHRATTSATGGTPGSTSDREPRDDPRADRRRNQPKLSSARPEPAHVVTRSRRPSRVF